jgi:MSHA biogenesis protein MshQ
MKSKSGHVGRFYPAYLSITSFVDGDFVNANVSGVVPFTYIGQDFNYAATHPSFVVSAFSALNTVTTNYTDNLNPGDDWAKLNADSVSFVAPSADASQNGADGITPMVVSYTEDPLDFDVVDNGAGTYRFEFRDDIFSYDKDANSQVKPFSSDINLVITNVTDTDGVVTSSGETLSPTPIDMRFGRLRMENAYGSELNDLIMNYHLEYYDVIGTTSFWTRHDDADTTIVAPGDINAVPGNTAATAINPSLLPGKFEITLSAPLIEVVETITNQVDGSGEPWLQYDWDGDGLYDNNPSALATFGIFDGNPVQIYIQQIYQ